MLRFTSGSTVFLLLGQEQLVDLPSMDNVNHLIDNFLLFTLHMCIYIYSRWVTNGNLRTLMIFQKMCVIMFTLNICWTCIYNYISSGKHTKNYGKSPFLMGKLTISMAIFQLAFSMFTRPGISPWFGANNTHMIICLVVEPYPSEKCEFVTWDDGIPNLTGAKRRKCREWSISSLVIIIPATPSNPSIPYV